MHDMNHEPLVLAFKTTIHILAAGLGLITKVHVTI